MKLFPEGTRKGTRAEIDTLIDVVEGFIERSQTSLHDLKQPTNQQLHQVTHRLFQTSIFFIMQIQDAVALLHQTCFSPKVPLINLAPAGFIFGG
jgi:hypothetical protein